MNRFFSTLLAATFIPFAACAEAPATPAPSAPAVVVSKPVLPGVPAKRLERPVLIDEAAAAATPAPAPPRVALPRVHPAPPLPAAATPTKTTCACPDEPAALAVSPAKPALEPLVRPEPRRPLPAPKVVVGDRLEIVDAALATAVEERVPLGVATTFTNDVGYIWAWTKVKNPVAKTHITHIWKRDGKVRATVELRVGKSSGWRTWSKKKIRSKDLGRWEIEVLADDGTLLDTLRFDVAPLSGDPLAGQ